MARIPNQYGDNDGKALPEKGDAGNLALISYILPKIDHARRVRDNKYALRWKEYTRLWRGFWTKADKNTNSERSKLISPALQQAIEMTTSEIEEAVFGRQAWFTIQDDLEDQQKQDATVYRDLLLEDFETSGVPDACAKVFLLGAIYGTGIGKINVTRRHVPRTVNGQTQFQERVLVTLDAIRPDQFVIDPSAQNINEAHYVAHDMIKPKHLIDAKMQSGVYRKHILGHYTGSDRDRPRGDSTGTNLTNNVEPLDEGVLITEYFGKVPAHLLGLNGTHLVEALVTIANDSHVLKAVESPFTNKDRPFVSYQHDTVPGEFWGRGVAEKGYNPQKALDSELRARMDALALTTAPMLGADMTKVGKNPDLRIRPGKVFLTRGRASEAIEPVGFSSQGLALTFQNSGDLERMVQQATGAMDSATPLNINRRNETAGGMSMLNSGFLKRAKRTMQNIERNFLDPLIQKSLWRYMQFEPRRYPVDMVFTVHSTMGLMAKEVEQSTLTQVLGFVPPDSPAHKVITAAILNNTTSANEGDVKKAVEAMLAPPSQEQQQAAQMQQQAQLTLLQEQVKGAQLENQKLMAEIQKLAAEAKHTNIKAELEDDEMELKAANAVTNAENARNKRAAIDAQRESARLQARKGKGS